MSIEILPGSLYLVATPIGNLGDISQRAVQILAGVELIAAEDTRHSQRLLNHLGIQARCQAYHEHNEQQQAAKLIQQLEQGASIALISDAGTPLVSDPGYRLVELAHQHGIRVVPIPGACAAIAALSVAGLPTDRFAFEGFPPAKHGARLNYFKALEKEPRTLVFYESCHRIVDSLQDMRQVLGDAREITLAREITKNFETIRKTTLAELAQWVSEDADQSKGEMVLIVAGYRQTNNAEHADDPDLENLLQALVDELPLKQAAKIAARVTGINKNETYRLALALKKHSEDTP